MKNNLIMGLALLGGVALSVSAQTTQPATTNTPAGMPVNPGTYQTQPPSTGSQTGTYQTQPTTTNGQYDPARTSTQQPPATRPNPQNSNTGNNNTEGVTNPTQQERLMQEGNTRRNRNINRSTDRTTEEVLDKKRKKRMNRRSETGRTTRPRSRTNPQ